MGFDRKTCEKEKKTWVQSVNCFEPHSCQDNEHQCPALRAVAHLTGSMDGQGLPRTDTKGNGQKDGKARLSWSLQ